MTEVLASKLGEDTTYAEVCNASRQSSCENP
jgi:hypothetical protein